MSSSPASRVGRGALRARLGLVALALSVALAPALARAAAVELTVDTAASSVGATLTVTVLGSSDSDTVTDVPFTGNLQAGVGLTEDPTYGLVATAVRFFSGTVNSTGTTFGLQVMPVITIDITVVVDDIAGSFGDEVLAAGPPTAGHTAPFDLVPTLLAFDSGSLVVTVDPPGDDAVLDLSESPLVFGLVEPGTVVTQPGDGGIEVTVTVPVDETASVSVDGTDVDLELFGDLVLRGEIATTVPSLSPLGVSVLAASLIGASLNARRPS